MMATTVNFIRKAVPMGKFFKKNKFIIAKLAIETDEWNRKEELVDKPELTRILKAKHNPAVPEGTVTAIVRYAPIRGPLHLQQLI